MNELWFEAKIEGVKGAIAVDTGAEITILNKDKYDFLLRGGDRKLPAGTSATTDVNDMTARVALARNFNLGGTDLGGSLVALVPQDELYVDRNFSYRSRAREFDGLMGENFLRHYGAVIDCSRQLLYLSLNSVRTQTLATVLPAHGWTRVPMSDVQSDFACPVCSTAIRSG